MSRQPSREILAEKIKHEREVRELEHKYVAEEFSEFRTEMQRRLGELNHAHEQAVAEQARTVPREMFDQFVKENDNKRENSFKALGDRLEASIDNVKQTHRVAMDSITSKVDTETDALSKQIEVERNARIRAEGSVSVWRFIAVFLGFPGMIGLLLALIALFSPGPTLN